jgi:hypothetical protein
MQVNELGERHIHSTYRSPGRRSKQEMFTKKERDKKLVAPLAIEAGTGPLSPGEKQDKMDQAFLKKSFTTSTTR